MAWKVKLSWQEGDPSQPGDGFKIYKSVDSGTFSLVATLPLSQTSWEDTDVEAGHKYSYRVTEYKGSSESPAAETTAYMPAAPGSCTASYVNDNQIDVSWTDVANDQGYEIERQTDDGTWAALASVGPNVIGYSDTSTVANHKYVYRIRAKGTPNYVSDWVYSTAVYTTPAAPSNPVLEWVDVGSQLKLTITDNATYEQNIEFELEIDGVWQGAVAQPANTTSYVWNVSGNHRYRARARATRSSPDALQSAWATSGKLGYAGTTDAGQGVSSVGPLSADLGTSEAGSTLESVDLFEETVGMELVQGTDQWIQTRLDFSDQGTTTEKTPWRRLALEQVGSGSEVIPFRKIVSQQSGNAFGSVAYRTLVGTTNICLGIERVSFRKIVLDEISCGTEAPTVLLTTIAPVDSAIGSSITSLFADLSGSDLAQALGISVLEAQFTQTDSGVGITLVPWRSIGVEQDGGDIERVVYRHYSLAEASNAFDSLPYRAAASAGELGQGGERIPWREVYCLQLGVGSGRTLRHQLETIQTILSQDQSFQEVQLISSVVGSGNDLFKSLAASLKGMDLTGGFDLSAPRGQFVRHDSGNGIDQITYAVLYKFVYEQGTTQEEILARALAALQTALGLEGFSLDANFIHGDFDQGLDALVHLFVQILGDTWGEYTFALRELPREKLSVPGILSRDNTTASPKKVKVPSLTEVR